MKSCSHLCNLATRTPPNWRAKATNYDPLVRLFYAYSVRSDNIENDNQWIICGNIGFSRCSINFDYIDYFVHLYSIFLYFQSLILTTFYLIYYILKKNLINLKLYEIAQLIKTYVFSLQLQIYWLTRKIDT